MTPPTNIIRLGDKLGAPARADDTPLQVRQRETPVVGPADRIAAPEPRADLTNVIAFAPLRRDGPVSEPTREEPAQKIVLGAEDRLTTSVGNNDTRRRIIAMLAFSGLVHVGILALLNREPPAMASIGIEAISVELVLGTNSATGPATNPTEAPPIVQEQPPAPAAATQEAAVPPQEDKPEAMTANPVPPPPEARTEPEPVTARPEAAVPAPEPSPPQMAPEPTPAHPVAIAPPPPANKPVVQAPPLRAAKPPARAAPLDQKQPAARPPRADGRLAAREPATAPGGVGPGRSDLVSNYRGVVFAHLSRQQRVPTGVLRPGERRTGTVSFTIDGSGRATRIVLVRPTGVASLDEEAQAMVRRASPFPPPPGGRPIPIAAPVAFSVR